MSVYDAKDVFDLVFKAVAQDQDLAAWATLNLGASLLVKKEIESDALSGDDSIFDDDNIPNVIIGGAGFRASAESRTRTHVFDIDLMLKKTGFETRAEQNTTVPTSADLIQEMVRLVRLAIVNALPSALSISHYEHYVDTSVEELSFGMQSIEIIERITIGTNPLS